MKYLEIIGRETPLEISDELAVQLAADLTNTQIDYVKIPQVGLIRKNKIRAIVEPEHEVRRVELDQPQFDLFNPIDRQTIFDFEKEMTKLTPNQPFQFEHFLAAKKIVRLHGNGLLPTVYSINRDFLDDYRNYLEKNRALGFLRWQREQAAGIVNPEGQKGKYGQWKAGLKEAMGWPS